VDVSALLAARELLTATPTLAIDADTSAAFDADSFASSIHESDFHRADGGDAEARLWEADHSLRSRGDSSQSSYFAVAVDAPQLDPAADGADLFSLAALRRRPTAPTGTMFLWSLSPPAADEDVAPVARRSASAGVVLSRPPGDYSLDWVGVAVSAPIH
jgi:hypothetical protein